MAVRLYDWGPSPFCIKARAVLDYKRIDFERVNVLGPAMVTVWRKGKIGKVPAVDWDGQFIADSTDIAYHADAVRPEPPLFPSAPRQRALCHALEDWADESLYFIGLYLQWQHPEGRAAVPAAFGTGPLGRIAFRTYLSRIRRQLHGQGIARKSESQVMSDLARHLDAIDALLADDPYLLGAAPFLCDFAATGQLVYLSRTPVGGRTLQGRRAIGDYLERMRALRRDR